MKKQFKVIGFDADDTLWVNEPYFRETEEEFCQLLEGYGACEEITRALLETELANLPLFGYGIKGFTLSMMETALKICNNDIPPTLLKSILELGKSLLQKPVILLDNVEEVLKSVNNKDYQVIIATKGDLLDQQRKLSKSGLEKYFHHIEIMSDKKEADYMRLLNHLEIAPENFLMVGNSIKSDILPVLNIGGSAIHIPFHTTWAHEEIAVPEDTTHYHEVQQISNVLNYL